MSFLFPQFLWALSFLSIPIIIHLFNFRRPKKVAFSNVQLLENIKASTSSVQNLKHLLILLSRLLFLALLILAFAQPYIPASNDLKSENAMQKIFYLDNSFSMQQEKDGATLLNFALSGLEDFQSIIGSNEEVYFLDNDFQVKDLFPYSKNGFMDRISEVESSFSPRSMTEILQRVNEQGDNSNKEIFIISDFQKSTLGDISELELDSQNIYHIIPIQNLETSNIYIDSIWLKKPFVLENEDNELNVRFNYQGVDPIENFPVKLFIDDRQAAASSISLQAGNASEIVFSLPQISGGIKKGYITINDNPVFFDNEYYFILNPVNDINVSVLGEKENPYFKALFETEDIFKYTFIPLSNPDLTALSASDFIVLDAIEDYPNYLKDLTKKALDEGVHILLNPNPKADNLDFLSEFNLNVLSALVEAESIELKKPDLSNPFFQGIFDDLDNNTDMPRAKAVLNLGGFQRTHLFYRDGKTFLGEREIGSGKMYVFTADIGNESSNFYRHSIFVPVMYKMLIESVNNENNALAYTFGKGSISLELDARQKSEAALRLKRESFEIIPEQNPTKSGLRFKVPNINLEAGFFELVLNDSLIAEIAMNINRNESRMEFLQLSEIDESFAKYKNVILEESMEFDAFAREYRESRFGTPLWKYFLICSLLFLLAEIILIRLR